MTSTQFENHPFRAKSGGVWFDSASRLDRVKEMDATKLRAVLALPDADLQKTVRLAAERRLRKLEKAG